MRGGQCSTDSHFSGYHVNIVSYCIILHCLNGIVLYCISKMANFFSGLWHIGTSIFFKRTLMDIN
jgi:hypothetical protein